MNECPANYLQDVANRRELYNPFNLIIGDSSSLMYCSKQTSGVKELKPGIYGLSNHLLDTPWPKVLKSKQALASYIEKNALIKSQVLFEILADDEKAFDYELPNTGINYVFEKQLSSIFIKGMDYGTRSSTVLLIDRYNHVTFTEKSFSPGQKNSIEVTNEFNII
ncbi:MAG: NRDE family protein [Desulfosporosinus sp.]|nr:NRDE family protein [Desulfosporosinus sp.]